MVHRSLPVQLAAIAITIAVVAGWVVNSAVRASSATRQQQIIALTTRSADQKALAIYLMQGLAESDRCWEGVASARSHAYQLRVRLRSLPWAGGRRTALIEKLLRREQVFVDQLSDFAGDANVDETSVLDLFRSASVPLMRQDLADAVAGIHDETWHWTRAIQDLLSARSAASGAAPAKTEFDAADAARVRASAAQARLSNEWTAVAHLLRVRSEETQSELSAAR